jgi:hypothetical protein
MSERVKKLDPVAIIHAADHGVRVGSFQEHFLCTSTINMKKEVGTFIISFVVSISAAMADGFDCESKAENIKIRVENHRKASEGTRNVEFMTLENLDNVNSKLRLDQNQGSLRNRSTYYFAKIDLRFAQIRNSTLEVFSQALTDFETIYLNVDFSYGRPVSGGTKVRAEFSAIERDSKELLKFPLICERIVD